jgi:hypothetical protein
MGSNRGFYQSLIRAVPDTCQEPSLTQRPHGTRPAQERVGFGFVSPVRDIGRLLGVSHQVSPGPRQGPLTAPRRLDDQLDSSTQRASRAASAAVIAASAES